MSHETNTFSPVPTPLERFGDGINPPTEGEMALALARQGRSTMAGMLAEAEKAGAEIVTPIAAGAPPSGPVAAEAYAYICKLIGDAANGCDAILLDLHGAMVPEGMEDGEGTLLARLREQLPDIPIAVGLDMHTNLYPAMVDNATVITGYKTYPHIDAFETGVTAARILFDSLAGRCQPVMVWGNRPMLPHVMRQGTDDEPNKSLQARARQMEENGEALSATVFTGFPHADIENAGLSAIVITDGDQEKALALRDELLDMAWSNRAAFVYTPRPLAASVAEAKAAGEEKGIGPVILLDHYDNTASGGTMDTTEVLREIIAQELEDVAAFGIYDPEAVEAMIQAGVGSEITLHLGANLPMPALAVQSQPLEVSGRVRLISDGKYRVTGPMSTGAIMHMGKTAILDTGKVQIIVISHHVEPFDLGCFTSLGIDPMQKTYLMLKSRIHYRASFMPIARKIIECAGCGVCTSDYSQLTFTHVRRPIYPLDDFS